LLDKIINLTKRDTTGDTTVPFTTTNTYTNAKVMVWDSLSGMKPICDTEIVL